MNQTDILEYLHSLGCSPGMVLPGTELESDVANAVAKMKSSEDYGYTGQGIYIKLHEGETSSISRYYEFTPVADFNGILAYDIVYDVAAQIDNQRNDCKFYLKPNFTHDDLVQMLDHQLKKRFES